MTNDGLECGGLISQAGLSAAGEQRSDGPSSAQIRPRARTAQQPGGCLLVAEGAVLGWGLGA